MAIAIEVIAVPPEPAPAWLLNIAGPHAPPGGVPRGGGGESLTPPCPLGQGVGGSGSLVQYKSITHTPQYSPSEIAQSALDDLLKLNRSDKKISLEDILVCKYFVDYLDKCEQKGFWIKGFDTKKGNVIRVPLSYENRWLPGRRRELKEKLERLEYWFDEQQDRPVTMITLTSYHEGISIPAAWHELNKSRDKLLKLIRKYFGNVDYFWVPEPHKSGYVHYHMAVFADVSNNVKDNKGRGIEDKFRDLWSRKYKTGNHTYGLDFSQKKGDGKIKHLKNYLSKYLEKGFLHGKWTPGILLFNSYLHQTGFRLYGASKNIRAIMNIKDDEPSQTVWLETRIEQMVEDSEGNDIYDDHVIWYRQYIPDWLDSDFWLGDTGQVRVVDPPPQYIFDWGRKLRDDIAGHGHDPTGGLITSVRTGQVHYRPITTIK